MFRGVKNDEIAVIAPGAKLCAAGESGGLNNDKIKKNSENRRDLPHCWSAGGAAGD